VDRCPGWDPKTKRPYLEKRPEVPLASLISPDHSQLVFLQILLEIGLGRPRRAKEAMRTTKRPARAILRRGGQERHVILESSTCGNDYGKCLRIAGAEEDVGGSGREPRFFSSAVYGRQRRRKGGTSIAATDELGDVSLKGS